MILMRSKNCELVFSLTKFSFSASKVLFRAEFRLLPVNETGFFPCEPEQPLVIQNACINATALAFPLTMLIGVLVTANNWLLDAVAGICVVSVAVAFVFVTEFWMSHIQTLNRNLTHNY
jgi:hypothetical protein